MRFVPSIALAALALVLAACSGSSFGSGMGAPGGMNPPVEQQPMGNQQGMPGGTSPTPAGPIGSATPSAPPGETASYPFTQAPEGFRCPESQGYSCFIRFNATPAPATAAKSAKLGKASPSPSPTPTPTPTPSPTPSVQPSGSGAPSASPSASPTPNVPTVSLTLGALPKDAPPMTNPDSKAVGTLALISLRMKANADVTIQGNSSADFTLPQSQIGGRVYAIQLYHETIGRKNKVSDQFFGSYSQSKLAGNTLHFDFSVPQIDVKKNETWLFVLYGAETPSASGAPTFSPSPSASASSAASGAPSTAPSASALPPGSSLNALPGSPAPSAT